MRNVLLRILPLILAAAFLQPVAQESNTRRNVSEGSIPALANSVVTGGVTHTKARFWARLTEPGDFYIELSTDPAFTSVLTTNTVSVNSLSYMRGIVEIEGLQPDTRYYYRVKIINGAPDNAQRSFSTFPVPGTSQNFTFAFGSCLNSGNFLPSGTPPGTIFRQIVQHNPRFFLQLGDFGYPDTTDNLPFNPNFFAGNMQLVQGAYHVKYDKNYLMDTLISMMPVDYIYDDHDFMNDNSGALTSSFFIPWKPNPLSNDFYKFEFTNPAGARTNSITGYKENMPGYPLVNESRGIYHKFTYGNVEIFALDLRSQRSPNLNSINKNTTTGLWEFTPPAGHSILGRDNAPGSGESQLTWFLNGLLNSTAKWKFILSSVPFNKGQLQGIQMGITLQDSILGLQELPPGTRGIFAAMELADKWVGFPEDLDTVLSFVNNNQIKNVIVLSGDSHTAAIDDGTNAGFPEIMAGGLDITNSKLVALLSAFGVHIWNKGGQGITTQVFNNAFGKVEVFGGDSVRLSLVDETGIVFATHTVTNSEPIPVELTSFTGSINGGKAVLRWSTATEQNNAGFAVERSTDGTAWEQTGYIRGAGTTTESREYQYTEMAVSGTMRYRLKQIDFDGSYSYYGPVVLNNAAPEKFELLGNYPNPFNPSTVIRFALPLSGEVSAAVYDISGRKVRELVSGVMEAGYHSVPFDAGELSSGVYMYQITARGKTLTGKMILMK